MCVSSDITIVFSFVNPSELMSTLAESIVVRKTLSLKPVCSPELFVIIDLRVDPFTTTEGMPFVVNLVLTCSDIEICGNIIINCLSGYCFIRSSIKVVFPEPTGAFM